MFEKDLLQQTQSVIPRLLLDSNYLEQNHAWLQKLIKNYMNSNTSDIWDEQPLWKKRIKLLTHLGGHLNEKEIPGLFGTVTVRFSARLRQLAAQDRIIVCSDAEDFYNAMDEYYDIKEQRNISNHAKEDTEYWTSDELEQRLIHSLDAIEKLALDCTEKEKHHA